MDIVFIIDTTGSMDRNINNVKNNLNDFTKILDDAGISYRCAIITYSDAVHGYNSQLLKDENGNAWLETTEDVKDALSGIRTGNGYDETPIDAMGMMVTGDIGWRSDASRFAILLTDEGYSPFNNYGYIGMSDLINDLVAAQISTSVVSKPELERTYHDLYTETDGIFVDIYSTDFAQDLAKLAEHMRDVSEHTHAWSTPTFSWSGDCTSCQGIVTCPECGSTRSLACAVTTADNVVYTATLNFGDAVYTDVRTIAPSVTGGAHVIGSGDSCTLVCELAYEYFVDVWVDGVLVDPQYYTVVSGSTIVTLSSAYLDTLSVGTHSVTMNYNVNGTRIPVEASITISDRGRATPSSADEKTQNPESQPSGPVAPNTGDNSNLVLWVCLLGFCLVALVSVAIVRTRRNNG